MNNNTVFSAMKSEDTEAPMSFLVYIDQAKIGPRMHKRTCRPIQLIQE